MPDTCMGLSGKAIELMCQGEEGGDGKAPLTGLSVRLWFLAVAPLATTP